VKSPAEANRIIGLKLENLYRTFGSFTAVDGVSLEVAQGEFVSLVGPSGCGKTTILRCISGLLEPDSGRILLGGVDITHTPVHRRELGLMFQSYALFPHMTVVENVAFGLRRRGVSEQELRTRVHSALELVRLGGLEARFPRELSGGQQQCVALARAAVTEPKLLLLDEPLSNLEALLRDELRVELKRLQEQIGVTTIFVTHDQAEALTLSDRIVVLNNGSIEQIGSPEDIYHRPATHFVASFIGRSNFMIGEVVEREGESLRIRLANGLDVVTMAEQPLVPDTTVQVSLRHECIRLAGTPSPGAVNSFEGKIVFQAFGGPITHHVVQLANGTELLVLDLPARGAADHAAGEDLHRAGIRRRPDGRGGVDPTHHCHRAHHDPRRALDRVSPLRLTRRRYRSHADDRERLSGYADL
jgi:putative spermidine/putrescine transport system ATP-binding protein